MFDTIRIIQKNQCRKLIPRTIWLGIALGTSDSTSQVSISSHQTEVYTCFHEKMSQGKIQNCPRVISVISNITLEQTHAAQWFRIDNEMCQIFLPKNH